MPQIPADGVHDIAELVHLLVQLETERASPLRVDDIVVLIGKLIEGGDGLRMHTSEAALERLASARGLDRDELDLQLRQPPSDDRAELLEALAQPEHVGCELLAGLLRRPTGVRQGLARDAIHAFFTARWYGWARVLLDVRGPKSACDCLDATPPQRTPSWHWMAQRGLLASAGALDI